MYVSRNADRDGRSEAGLDYRDPQIRQSNFEYQT